MNLQWQSVKTRERLATCGRVLGVKWMKTVFADVKLWVLGEIRASTIGASEHDEWYNVSINYKDGEGPFFFYTLFTYKEPPSSFIATIL